MGLILSIPITAKAAYYDLTQKIDKVYQNYHYSFIPDSSIPSGYQISDEALNYVIEQGAKALNSYNTQAHGILINWAMNTVANGIYSLYRNGFITYSSIYAQLVDADHSVYSWDVSLLEIDPDYQYSNTYGAAYAFEFKGFCKEHLTIILDQNGDIYGSNPIGNYTYSPEVGVITEEYIPEQYDPNEIFVPNNTSGTFNDLEPPFIYGKELHFFVYENNNRHEVVIPDFTRTVVTFPPFEPTYFGILITNLDNADRSTIYVDNIQYTLAGQAVTYYATLHTPLQSSLTGWRFNFDNVVDTSLSDISISYPSYYDFNWNNNRVRIYNPNALGLLNGVQQSGIGDIWLDAISTNPTSTPANPNPAPIGVPIPVTQIPEDPEDPIPQNPTPDPVPGQPINPLPPIIRPLPSIVSGNDDLWPSVVELQNIEIDLGGYISGLDDYEFPDLSSITSSFSGAIVWVSTIMSTLFNGSDFSILFTVLSSLFIVAALLGLYKWWNHK